jgi:glycosyltransferase involved in cell wall biosynthesis
MDTERYLRDHKVPLKSRFFWFGVNLKWVESSLRSADHIIALTQQEKDYMRSRFSLPEDKISVIHHVLPEYFRGLPQPNFPESFQILFVSSWIEKKGIDYLVQALERFDQAGYDFQVTLAGVKVEESAIRQILSPSLARRVKIISSIKHRDLPELYLSHSVFVFPSLYEGFGKVLTEAMAAGLPVITTEAGVAQELIKHEENGIVIPYRDADAIYEALCLAYASPEIMRCYGRSAQSLINSLDFDGVYKQRLTIYEDLLK